MSKTNIGAARKRTATPASRHKRAVAYRHRHIAARPAAAAEFPEERVLQPQETAENIISAFDIEEENSGSENALSKLKMFFAGKISKPEEKKEEQSEEPAAETKENETVSEPETVQEVTESSAEQTEPCEVQTETSAEEEENSAFKTEVKEESAGTENEEITEETEEEPEEKEGLFAGIKARRTARRNEKKAQLDWEADLPRNGLFTMLFMPGTSIDRENREDGPVFGSFGAFFANIFKWIMAASAFVYPLYLYVQEKSFSTVSMNFTSAASLVLKIAVYGFVSEYLLIWILELIANITQHATEKRKLVSSAGRAGWGIGLAFGIAMAVMFAKGFAFGIAALTAAVIYSISLFIYGIDRCMRLSKTVQMIIIALFVFICALAGYKYISFIAPDVLELLHYIANL